MSEYEYSCCWPEQEAVENWWDKHSLELKKAVTAFRIEVEGRYRKRVKQLEEENRKLRKALERIANSRPCEFPEAFIPPERELPRLADCPCCQELINVAKETLAALDGGEKAVTVDEDGGYTDLKERGNKYG